MLTVRSTKCRTELSQTFSRIGTGRDIVVPGSVSQYRSEARQECRLLPEKAAESLDDFR
jgi:hypothetical protein